MLFVSSRTLNENKICFNEKNKTGNIHVKSGVDRRERGGNLGVGEKWRKGCSNYKTKKMDLLNIWRDKGRKREGKELYRWDAILCYAMACHANPCYAMLFHGMA